MSESHTADTRPGGGRLVTVDALRGSAALAVLLFHALAVHVGALSGPWRTLGAALYPITIGYVGVNLFLVISGFCIHLRLARTPAEQPMRLSFASFWRRRFRRLYPAYLAALLFSAALVIGSSMWLANDYSAQHLGETWRTLRWDMLAHVFMAHLFFTAFVYGLHNAALWTLALEEHLYLLYSPLLWLRQRLGLGGAVASIAAITIGWRAVCVFGFGAQPALPLGGAEGLSLLWMQAPARWFEWCLGAVAVEAYLGRVRLPDWCRNPKVAIGTLLLAAASAHHPLGWWMHDALWGVGFFCVLNCAVAREAAGAREVHGSGAVARIVRTLAAVGVFSYSLYLIHQPLLRVAGLLAHNFGLSMVIVKLLACAACVPLAYLFFLMFERPVLAPAGRVAVTHQPDWRDAPRRQAA